MIIYDEMTMKTHEIPMRGHDLKLLMVVLTKRISEEMNSSQWITAPCLFPDHCSARRFVSCSASSINAALVQPKIGAAFGGCSAVSGL